MIDERRTTNNQRRSTSSSVELYIEELVLRRFVPSDHYSIGEVVERELSRLLTEQATPVLTKRADMAQLDCGSFHMLPGANVEAVGVQETQAIGGGLTK